MEHDEAARTIANGETFEPQEHSLVMRDTSEEAFRAIKSDGLLSKMRQQVYEYLYHCGPATGAEIDRELKMVGGGRGHYHKRLSELERLGVAKRVGTRECKVTGRRAEMWDVTSSLPMKPPPKVRRPNVEHLRAALDDARRCWREHEREGTALSEGFVLTMRWLASMVPPRCETCNGTGRIKGDGFVDSCPDCTGGER